MGGRKPEWVSRVKKQVWHKFPDMKSVEPKLASRALVRKGVRSGAKKDRSREARLHTLTFRKNVRMDDGARSTRIVRVVTDDKGRILKVVCSR